MGINNCTIYIKGDQCVEVQKKDITLGDVISMECSNTHIVPKLQSTKLLKMHDSKRQRCVVSILKIIEKIHEQYPGLEIQNLGACDIIITYEPEKKQHKLLHMIKTSLVLVTTFTGAAFSIMTFNNDVDVPRLFSQIYEQIMGYPKMGFTVMELMYSLGVVLGILIFFNHFGKKRFSMDPTPMEVEMRTYENDIQTTVIDSYSRREQEIDVD